MFKLALRLYAVLHAVLALLFACVGVALIGIAASSSWRALAEGFDEKTAQALIEALGMLAVAAVGLQISQTIGEEEVMREAHISAPTRVRRYLSRFLVVVIVALRRLLRNIKTTLKRTLGDRPPH